jgi:hypothetical protein
MNLQLTDGLLVTLVGVTNDDLPQGLRLAHQMTFDGLGLAIGDSMMSRGELLCFEGSNITIHTHEARSWNGSLKSLAGHTRSPEFHQALNELYTFLRDQTPYHCGGLKPQVLIEDGSLEETILNGHAREAILALLQATRCCRQPSDDVILQMVGLGPGLTPSGDDFLLGFQAGLWSCAAALPVRTNFVTRLGERINAIACSKTNVISSTYLLHVSQAQVSRRLYTIAKSICENFPYEQRIQAAQAVLMGGHTSGLDTLIGLLAGLIAWSPFNIS